MLKERDFRAPFFCLERRVFVDKLGRGFVFERMFINAVGEIK